MPATVGRCFMDKHNGVRRTEGEALKGSVLYGACRTVKDKNTLETKSVIWTVVALWTWPVFSVQFNVCVLVVSPNSFTIR